MLKTVAQLGLASLFVTAFAGTALAQDDFSEDMEPEPAAATDTAPAAAASSSDSSDGLTMAISTAFPTGGDNTANLLYGLAADTWLDLSLGLNFGPGPDTFDMMGNPVAGDDIIGLQVGVGYRMYKPNMGKIRPYLEPAVFVAIDDVGEAGDTMDIGGGALLGVDYALMDQFTLGTGIGAGLSYVDLDSLQFGLFTANINATFWW